MSGRKTSPYVLNIARQERATALGLLQSQQRELNTLLHSMDIRRQLLLQLSAIQVSADDVSVGDWQKSVRCEVSSVPTFLSSIEQLRQGAANCRNLLQTGTQLADAIEKSLQRVHRLQTEAKQQEMKVVAASGELSEWLGSSSVGALKAEGPRIRDLIRKGDLEAAESSLERMRKHLHASKETALQRQQEAIRLQKLDAARSIANSVASTCKSLAEFVRQTPPGHREFFKDELAEFQKWQSKTEQFLGQCQVAKDSDLDSIIEDLVSMNRDGEALRCNLEDSFVVRADQLESECESQLGDIRGRMGASQTLLKKWARPEGLEQQSARLKRLDDLLANRDIRGFQTAFAVASLELSKEIDFASVREQSHEKRIYLVSAIVEVCEGMGFRMTKKAHLEDAMDRGSCVRVTFDTGNRGEVMFAVSLDSIEVDSCIAGTHCFEEFQKLSEQLREEFGVETHFRGDDSFQPRKIRKGELDEPTGSHQSAG